jgi:hypothetical protein
MPFPLLEATQLTSALLQPGGFGSSPTLTPIDFGPVDVNVDVGGLNVPVSADDKLFGVSIDAGGEGIGMKLIVGAGVVLGLAMLAKAFKRG